MMSEMCQGDGSFDTIFPKGRKGTVLEQSTLSQNNNSGGLV